MERFEVDQYDLTEPNEPFRNPLFNPLLSKHVYLQSCLVQNINSSLQGNYFPNIHSFQTVIERHAKRGHTEQQKSFLGDSGLRLPENTLFVKLRKCKDGRYLSLERRHISSSQEADLHCKHPVTMLPRAMLMNTRTIILIVHFMELQETPPTFAHSYLLRFHSTKGWCFQNLGDEPVPVSDKPLKALKHATHIKWYTWRETDQTHLQPEKAKTHSKNGTSEHSNLPSKISG